MSSFRELTKRLYRRVGQFNLYFRFNPEDKNFDMKKLRSDIEDIKKIIFEIENEIDNN